MYLIFLLSNKIFPFFEAFIDQIMLTFLAQMLLFHYYFVGFFNIFLVGLYQPNIETLSYSSLVPPGIVPHKA